MTAAEGSGAGTAGGGGTRKVDPAEVRSIANAHVATAKDRVEAALATFRATADGDGAFGGSEAGAQLASLHSSVKTVFTDTVVGVTTDLSTYHQNLVAAANAWEASEDASATHSRALVERLTAAASSPLATAESWNGSRREQGESLGLGDTLAEHADDPPTGEDSAEDVSVEAAELPESAPGAADPSVAATPTSGGEQPLVVEPAAAQPGADRTAEGY